MKPMILTLLVLSSCATVEPAPTSQPGPSSRPAPASRPTSPAALTREAERQCHASNTKPCLAAVSTLAHRLGQDHRTVQQLWRRACGAGSDEACLLLVQKSKMETRTDLVVAALTEMAQRNKKSGTIKGTLASFTARCEGGHGSSCSEAALRHEEGKGVPKNPRLGRHYHRLACALGYWFSCNNLTLIYEDRLGEKISRRMFMRMCQRDSAYGCYWIAARLLSGLGGLPKRPKQGQALMKKSCDGGYGTACYSLALGQSDEQQKTALLQRGCKGGSPDACEELKRTTGARAALVKARKACLGDRGEGCYTAGLKLMQLDLAMLPSKPHRQQRAVAYLTKGCQLKHGPACTELGLCHADGKGVARDRKRAAALYGQGCTLGHASGCARLANCHELGEGVPRDRKQAAVLYQKACHAGLLSACRSLGELYLERENGPPRAPRKGARLLLRACTGGEHDACEAIARRLGRKGVAYPQVLAALRKLRRASKDEMVVRFSYGILLAELGDRKPPAHRRDFFGIIRAACKVRKPAACAVKRLIRGELDQRQ